MLLTDTFPEPLSGIFQAVHKSAGPPRFACRADVDADGRLVDQYLAVTSSRLLVIAGDGAEGRILHDFALADITSVSIDPMVGVSALIATVAESEIRLLRFTYAVSEDFSNAVERLQAVVGANYHPEIWGHYPIHTVEAEPDWASEVRLR